MVDLVGLKSEQRHKNARQACIFPCSTGVVWKMPHERLQSWVFWLCHMLRKCSGLHPPSMYPVIHPAGVPTAPQGSWWRALWSGFCMICVGCCWGFLGGVEGGGCLEHSWERSMLIIAWAKVCILTSLLWEVRWAWSRLGLRSSGRISALGWLIWWLRHCPMCPQQCEEKLLQWRKFAFFESLWIKASAKQINVNVSCSKT